jgi:hypothetical protein
MTTTPSVRIPSNNDLMKLFTEEPLPLSSPGFFAMTDDDGGSITGELALFKGMHGVDVPLGEEQLQLSPKPPPFVCCADLFSTSKEQDIRTGSVLDDAEWKPEHTREEGQPARKQPSCGWRRGRMSDDDGRSRLSKDNQCARRCVPTPKLAASRAMRTSSGHTTVIPLPFQNAGECALEREPTSSGAQNTFALDDCNLWGVINQTTMKDLVG